METDNDMEQKKGSDEVEIEVTAARAQSAIT